MDSRGRPGVYDSEQRYESVVRTMSEGVVVQDADAVILACNEAAERLLGLTADQMMGRASTDPRWRSIHEDGSPFPGDTHPVPVTLRTGQPQRDVVMGVHKPDGTLTWISINSDPLFREGEPKPFAAVCTFTDITQRKDAEEALRTSEERYRRIIETTLEGVWMIDLQGNTTFANRRMAEMLGCTAEEAARSNVWDFVDPADRASVTERLSARSRGVGEVHDFRLRRKDGQFVDTSMATSPITLQDGRMGALAMVRDVSAERRMAQLESIGRLAGGVAHDFNNLLTVILASVTLAEATATPQVTAELSVIRTAAERGADLTQQLLAFARKQVMQLATLDLNEIIRKLSGVLGRLVGEDVALELALAEDLWPIRAGTSQIEQVIVNLAVNARDAMAEGGPLHIATSNVVCEVGEQVRAGEYVTLTVRDRGAGIDPTTLPHIFEPFFTTKSTGTGLGLASSHGIVEQLGGSIRVDSELGAGSTFTVYLPRERAPVATSAPPEAATSARRSKPTVLLVEDEELLRRVIARSLVDRGYHVLVACDGEDALGVAARHDGPIDIMVTDVIMPKMSGRQLADRIAQLRPDTKILFTSGYTDQIIARKGVLEPGQHFLAKPYSMDALEKRIDELVS